MSVMIMQSRKRDFKLKVLVLALHKKAKWILLLFKINPQMSSFALNLLELNRI